MSHSRAPRYEALPFFAIQSGPGKIIFILTSTLTCANISYITSKPMETCMVNDDNVIFLNFVTKERFSNRGSWLDFLDLIG